jgi:hypothetical protein
VKGKRERLSGGTQIEQKQKEKASSGYPPLKQIHRILVLVVGVVLGNLLAAAQPLTTLAHR